MPEHRPSLEQPATLDVCAADEARGRDAERARCVALVHAELLKVPRRAGGSFYQHDLVMGQMLERLIDALGKPS